MAKKKNPSVVKGEIVLADDDREAPSERHADIKDIINPSMSNAQLNLLLNKTPAYAVQKRPGPGGRQLSYVKHGYVTDQLNKAFGFDWDLILDPIEDGKMYAIQLEQVINNKGESVGAPSRHLSVCGHLVVRVRNKDNVVISTITKSGFGSQMWNASMEFGDALKAAKSDLLKVCAAQIGVALDLYWNDRAELAQYNERIEEQAKTHAEALKIATQAPTSPAMLIARSKSDYDISIDELMKLSKVKSVDELMKLDAKRVDAAWNAILEEYDGGE